MSDEEFKELKQIVAIAKSDIQNLEFRAENSNASWHTRDEELFHNGIGEGIEQATEEYQNTIDAIEKLIKNIEQGEIFSQKREPSEKQIPLI